MNRKPEPCYTCRNRRIQCDQSGVPCRKCQNAGLECLDQRPLRWVKGVAIRGKMQGRSFEKNEKNSSLLKSDNKVSAIQRSVTRAKPTSGSPRSGLDFNGKMNTIHESIMGKEFGLFLHSISEPSVALEDPSLLNLDRVSRYYIDYYNERICKLFIVYDSDKNPFRSLIPMGMKNPVLLKALLALAARHHVNTGQSFDNPEMSTAPGFINAHRDALSLKHQAMEALSHSLRGSQSCNQDTTVASIFLLIFLDLIESGSDGWNFHLEGAKKLIASTYPQVENQAGINQGPGETLQEIRSFITRQIYLIETLGAAFSRPKLLTQSSLFDQQEMQLHETVEKSFLGCPEYILTAIQCLSFHRDSITASITLDDTGIASHRTDTESLLDLLQNFDDYTWASNVQSSRDSSLQDIANLCMLSQAYKLGAYIYGRRILDALTQTESVQDRSVSELLGLINFLKDDPALFKCILWPVFVAGLECKWQAQRDFLVGCLERFWSLTSCLNGVNAAKILQEYWQQGDLSHNPQSQWIFNIGNLGRDWLWI
ncbi:hypothetical protein N7478_001197 [Penicillium angulare]|uniref:uncharacterized protein n=1 Tax=Penicillium angulare TaxID=116970 RepID=UPI0025416CE1|nr:uncharacterized protein N7478_001197 [Penicillium angulare]KAJ5291946.1 hypothetical protein N7478_001197 [Penicillium angulare]